MHFKEGIKVLYIRSLHIFSVSWDLKDYNDQKDYGVSKFYNFPQDRTKRLQEPQEAERKIWMDIAMEIHDALSASFKCNWLISLKRDKFPCNRECLQICRGSVENVHFPLLSVSVQNEANKLFSRGVCVPYKSNKHECVCLHGQNCQNKNH